MNKEPEKAAPTAIYVEAQGWFSASRLPRHLAQAGFRVIGLFAADSPASRSAFLETREIGATGALASWLDALIGRYPDAIILPADEAALQLVHPLLLEDDRASPAVRTALQRSLGPAEGRAIAASKQRTIELAARLGLAVPLQAMVDSHAEAVAFARLHSYPIVLKLENSAGGAGVRICRNEDEVAAAFVELAKGGRVDRALRRLMLLVGRPIPALLRQAAARWGAPSLIVQQFIEGRPAFTTVAAWQGTVLAELVALVEQVLPRWIGLSSVVRFLPNREMSVATATLARALHLSGLVGVDFMIEEKTGRAFLLEINARSTPTVHLGRRLGADLCTALAAACRGAPASPATPSREEIVALFPNEIERDPASKWLRDGVYHDLPLDEPELMQAWRATLPRDSAVLRRLDELFADQGVALGIGRNTT